MTNWELFTLHQLHENGLTISEIARRSGLDRKAVRKYIQRGLTAPSYGPRAPRPQKKLRRRWNRGIPYNEAMLKQVIFTGSRS